MFRKLRFPHIIRSTMLVCICLLLVNALPPRSAHAALVTQPIDDTLAEFNRGNFQRAALGDIVSSEVADQAGAVQIAPIGLLTTWFNSPFRLPRSMYSMGATSIGNRIYLVGGVTAVTDTLTLDSVWSIPINPDTGAPSEDWSRQPSLIPVQASVKTGFDDAIAGISLPAVTSVTNANGSGYIYVMGGNVVKGTRDFSSFGVRIGTVDSSGTITGWVTGPTIPDQTGVGDSNLRRGLQAASAVSVNVNGVTYIYLIGGLQRSLQGTGQQITTVESGSKKIFYARVGANGSLVKPSNPAAVGWDLLPDELPLTADYAGAEGLWSAVAADSRLPETGQQALYVMGGQWDTNPTSYSPKVYRALINPNNGTLDWSGWSGTMPSSRINHAGVEFNGNLYLTGGRQGSSDQPDQYVLNSYIQDDLSLPLFGDPATGSNFLPNATALPRPRMLHGSVVIAASSGRAYVYVLGGRGNTNDAFSDDDNGTDSMIYGRVGGLQAADAENSAYAPTAWYYSKPLSIAFDRAEVREVSWATIINRSGLLDIEMAYRTSNSVDCNLETSYTAWVPLQDPTAGSYRSKHGKNAMEIGSPEARCFQYRARLLAATDLSKTPSLLNVTVKIFIPGYADLWVNNFAEKRGDNGRTLTGFDLSIINQVQNSSEPTIAVYKVTSGGSFFVDLCIYKPGETPATPPLPWPEPPTCVKAQAMVSDNTMGVDTVYNVTKNWYDANNKPISLSDMEQFFDRVGIYNLVAAVDTTNHVQEGENGEGEGNNTAELRMIVYPADETIPVDEEDEHLGLPPDNDVEPAIEIINPVEDTLGPVYLPLIRG